MSDYFNNIFDLIPKKTSKSGSIGDVVPKKKKQKAGGVTGMPNDEFSLDKFLSSESLVQDGLELPPSESTSTQRPIILTDQELKNKAQKGYVPTNREYLHNLGSTNTEPNVTDLVTSEPTTAQHIRSAIVNPAGTFGQISRGEKVIPDLPQGINDVTGMLNLAWYMDKLSKGVGNLTRGEYGSAGWNFLAGVPAIGPVAKAGLAYKAASKTKKFLSAPKSKIFNQGTKSQYKVTNLDPNLKQAQTLLNPTMTNNFATKIIESSGKANSQAMYAKELAAKNAIVASMLKGNKNKSSANSAKGGLGAMPGTFTRSSKIGTKGLTKTKNDLYYPLDKEPIYRGVYLNDEIRNSLKFKGKSDEEILDIMGTTIPGDTGTRRKKMLYQTLNFGTNEKAATEHILKHTNKDSWQKLGNTKDLTSGQNYVLKVQPSHMPTLSVDQQRNLYKQHIDAWKKANPDQGGVLGLDAKNINLEFLKEYGDDLAFRTKGTGHYGDFPQFIGKEGEKIGKLLEVKKIPISKSSAGVPKELAAKNAIVSNQLNRNLSDISSDVLKEVKPYANEFEHIIETNALSQTQARNLVEKGRIDEIYSSFKKGADTIDDFKKSYLKDLTSDEGIKRLIAQEADYLRSIGISESQIAKKAELAAFARINEIKDIGNINRKFAEGRAELSSVVDNPKHFNNAFYRQPNESHILDDVLYPKQKTESSFFYPSNPFERKSTRIGVQSHPGQTALGTRYSESIPTTAHEIGGHGLQSGRKLPVDDRLKKLEVNINNLNPYEKKAYNYYMRGSSGKEPSAFAHEFREAMLQAGLIKNRYQYISPEKIMMARMYFTKRPSGVINKGDLSFSSHTRILDFAKPTTKNFELLSREINKLPITTGAIGTGALLSQDK